MDEERFIFLRELEDHLDYRFKEMGWLDKALTHKSFINQTPTTNQESNEILEFLGDAVLNLVVSHLLLKRFPEAHEGILSIKRAHFVKKTFLAHLSKELQLERHLLLGKSELLNGGRMKPSILANTYEALIGAIYMDSGLDQALEMIERHLDPYLQSEPPPPLFHDHKSLLQAQSQRIYGLLPQYRVLREFGPDHDKRFQASVAIQGEVKGFGWGKNKKEAEQEAAKKALENLKDPNSNAK